MLASSHPESLTTADDESKFTPIHVILHNPNINALHDTVHFLVEANPSTLRLTNHPDRVPLHAACWCENSTLETMELLLNSWPEAARQRDHCLELPLHAVCWNGGLEEAAALEILALLLEACPESV